MRSEGLRTIPKLGFSVKEFAWSIGVSKSTAEREVRDNKVFSLKIRGCRIVPIAAAKKYMRMLEEEAKGGAANAA